MLRIIKLIILLNLGIGISCFSQTKTDSLVTNQYNTYLNALHLSQLVKASRFQLYSEFKHTGISGTATLNNVYILILEPEKIYSDPLKFLAIWNKLQDKLNGDTLLYSQLLFKLADFTGLRADSLAIYIKTTKPGIISYLVYFNKGVLISKPVYDTRGAGNLPDDITDDEIESHLYQIIFKKISFNANLTQTIQTSIIKFLLKNGDHIESSKPLIDNTIDGIVNIEVRNIKHVITNNFYEDINVSLIVIPTINNKATVICNFSIFISTRKFVSRGTLTNSRNAISEYADEVRKFSESLSDSIKF